MLKKTDPPDTLLSLFQIATILAKGDPMAATRLLRCFVLAGTAPQDLPHYRTLEKRSDPHDASGKMRPSAGGR